MELNKQLGQGGAGMHTAAPGSAAEALKALFGLKVSLIAGAAAGTKLNLADIRPGDVILAAHNNNSGAFTDVTASTTIDNPNATGTVTVGAATAGDSVTIAGLTYTLVAPGTAIDAGDMTKLALVGGQTAAVLAGRLAALVNAREDNRTSKVRASANAAVITLTAVEEGTVGNAVALAETGNTFTISGATLTGGTNTGGIKVNATTNQVVLYWLKKP